MTDKEILDIYKSEGGQTQAFNHIVREYSKRLYWHLRELVFNHDDADDLLQNTFMKVWKALPTFRGESGLYTWLYRIATNEAFTFLKKERLNNKFSLQGRYHPVSASARGCKTAGPPTRHILNEVLPGDGVCQNR